MVVAITEDSDRIACAFRVTREEIECDGLFMGLHPFVFR